MISNILSFNLQTLDPLCSIRMGLVALLRVIRAHIEAIILGTTFGSRPGFKFDFTLKFSINKQGSFALQKDFEILLSSPPRLPFSSWNSSCGRRCSFRPGPSTPPAQWLLNQEPEDFSLKVPKRRALHLLPPILGQDSGRIKRVRLSSISSMFTFCTPESDNVLDYVFVDEHNRHKRLKGMASSPHS